MLVGLAVVTVMTPQIAGAGSVAVDYAQCANGTGTSRACPDGWINGILQASNSHYHEDEVTPQRLTADVPTAGNHSITLRYQVKKDTTHAYDSLATWNLTQNVLVKGNRCDGLTAGKCAGALTMDPAVTNIPDDPASDSGSAAAGGNGDQDYDSHMIGTDNGHRQFELYGDNSPAFLAFDNPPYVHTMSGSDEYASIKINFSVAQAGKVQLLFGGHIAAPTGLR
ncbi:MAG TPA: hypothetical protein VMZ51_01690, partial [Acidimicrobiales bacterium]|nr:hypothetical protein [Acidimicrobiales bacterium]